jgi:hypothetical protein
MNFVDQIPPFVEWRVYRGDTSNLSLFLFDTEDNPIDIGGYEIYAQIRETPDSANVISTMSSSINENLIVLTIPDTKVLPEHSYFDVEAVSINTSDVKTLVKGNIIRELDVTRQ